MKKAKPKQTKAERHASYIDDGWVFFTEVERKYPYTDITQRLLDSGHYTRAFIRGSGVVEIWCKRATNDQTEAQTEGLKRETGVSVRNAIRWAGHILLDAANDAVRYHPEAADEIRKALKGLAEISQQLRCCNEDRH